MEKRAKLCPHFRSEGGCRKGARCRLRHALLEDESDRRQAKDEMARVVAPFWRKRGIVVVPLAGDRAGAAIRDAWLKDAATWFSNDVTASFPAYEVLETLAGPVLEHFGIVVQDLELFSSFAVSYATEGYANSKLVRHRDDSLLTVNLCLFSNCEGNEVRFHGSKPLHSRANAQTHEHTDVDCPSLWVTMSTRLCQSRAERGGILSCGGNVVVLLRVLAMRIKVGRRGHMNDNDFRIKYWSRL